MNINVLWQEVLEFVRYLLPIQVQKQAPTATVAEVIFAYNQPYTKPYPIIGGSQIDAQITKITVPDSQRIADLIVSNASRAKLPLSYFMACIMEESRFCETCFNHNLAEHHGIETFAGTDWGCAQFAGTFLPDQPGMLGQSEAKMQALVCTAEWSIPVMADIMASNITWATELLFDPKGALAVQVATLNHTTLTNAEWIATGAYNSGRTGIITNIMTNVAVKLVHPAAVAKWNDVFLLALTTT